MGVFWELNFSKNHYSTIITPAFYRIHKPSEFKFLHLWNGKKDFFPHRGRKMGVWGAEGIPVTFPPKKGNYINHESFFFLSWNKIVMGPENENTLFFLLFLFLHIPHLLLCHWVFLVALSFWIILYAKLFSNSPHPLHPYCATILSFLLESTVDGCLPSLRLARACSSSQRGPADIVK